MEEAETEVHSIVDVKISYNDGHQRIIVTDSGAEIVLDDEETIYQLKKLISVKDGIPFDVVKIIFNGVALEDDVTIFQLEQLTF